MAYLLKVFKDIFAAILSTTRNKWYPVIFLVAGAGAMADINVERLADAIYKAEGGAKTAHPYGILTKYKHTTPRAACINTIRHAQRDFNGKGDFIVFLGGRYCPVGASNDPKGLNKNWIKNVRYYYKK
jgi:hypothetical protein